MALTCAQLQKVVAKIDRIWADPIAKEDYSSDVGVLEALRKEQTAKIEELTNPDKDKEIRIWWLKDCADTVNDCEDDADDCEFSGDEVSQACEDYALDICINVKFSIEDNVFRTNEANADEALAKALARRLKLLDERLTSKAVAKLNTFVGTNQYTGGIGTVSGVTTYIKASHWGPDMFGYFGMVKTMNRFANPYLIHGSNLFQANWQAQYNAANANQKADAPKLSSMRSYWDLFNVDTINAPDSVSYMIDKGAIAFVSKARYPKNNPKVYQFGQRWSIESKALPGVWYDVYYKERCEMVNGVEKIWHDYKLTARAGVFLNPTGCNADKTGVLKFVCGTAPAES